MGEVERVGVDAALSLAEQTVHQDDALVGCLACAGAGPAHTMASLSGGGMGELEVLDRRKQRAVRWEVEREQLVRRVPPALG